MVNLIALEQIGGEKIDGVRQPISYLVFYESNMKPLGQMYQEVDGEYVYLPKLSGGCWSGHVLTELGNILTKLNNGEKL